MATINNIKRITTFTNINTMAVLYLLNTVLAHTEAQYANEIRERVILTPITGSNTNEEGAIDLICNVHFLIPIQTHVVSTVLSLLIEELGMYYNANSSIDSVDFDEEILLDLQNKRIIVEQEDHIYNFVTGKYTVSKDFLVKRSETKAGLDEYLAKEYIILALASNDVELYRKIYPSKNYLDNDLIDIFTNEVWYNYDPNFKISSIDLIDNMLDYGVVKEGVLRLFFNDLPQIGKLNYKNISFEYVEVTSENE